jgi:hypothetical protein
VLCYEEVVSSNDVRSQPAQGHTQRRSAASEWFHVIIWSEQFVADQQRGEMRGSHSAEYDDIALLGCDGVRTSRQIATFRINILSP